jgi:hypothetical protein
MGAGAAASMIISEQSSLHCTVREVVTLAARSREEDEGIYIDDEMKLSGPLAVSGWVSHASVRSRWLARCSAHSPIDGIFFI